MPRPSPSPAQWSAEHVVDTVRESLLILDADLRVHRANRSFYRTFSVAPRETEGRLVYELGNGQWDIPQLRKLLEEVLPGRSSFDDYEVAHDFPSVGRRVMLLNARRVHGNGDQTHAILLAIEDITERRRLEAERREVETRFTSLVKNVRDHSIFTLDPQGRITSWNREAERIFGYGEAEALGRHFSMIFAEEDRRADVPAGEVRAALREGRAEDERWHVRKGGERLWALGIITPTHDAAGRHTGFSKILRDMTERKRAEEVLLDSEVRFRLLVENVRDYALLTTDSEGRVTTWNPGAEGVFGYTREEIIGRIAEELFTPEDRAAGEHQKELATAAREGRASDDRWQVRKDGTRFWASGVTSAMRDAAGTLLGFAKVLRDQTETKEIEERRLLLLEREQAARREAERAMVIRDEFLAVVSHELRTPLSAILMFSQMLRGGAIKGEGQADALDAIVHSAEAQRQVIEDLLDVSRMISGKLRIEVRDADLARVVQAAVGTVRPMAEAKGVAVEVSLDKRVGRVRVDPERVQQVAWNLLNNAVKFTGKGGRVTVGLRRVGESVEIRVGDTGRGIKPEFLPHVFERFRQQDAGSTRAEGGLGLGLAICRQLAELHGGTIRAESEGEGKGATFTVTLPAADLRPRKPAPRRRVGGGAGKVFSPSPVLAGVRVLLMEDEVGMRVAVRMLLEKNSAHVTAVRSAKEALAAVAAGPASGGRFDVLVSDVGMPEMDGYELIRELRRAERERGEPQALPAVTLSAYAREEDRAKASEAGFDQHVAKPVEPEELVRVIAGLVRRHT